MHPTKQNKSKIGPLPEPQTENPAARNRYPYVYPSNQMLSDVLFAASGMGLVILLSHSIRLVGASSSTTLTATVGHQLRNAHQQAQAIGRQMNLIENPSLKTRLKQSL
jgi:hypothetical protein